MSVRHQQVGKSEDGLRLDRWFRKHFPRLPHGKLERLLRQGKVRVDKKRVGAATRIEQGQAVRIPPEVAAPLDRAPPAKTTAKFEKLAEELRPRILHRDDDILVLNKPSGLAVQGGSKTNIHVDAALPFLQFDADEPPRLVHRLDKDTSGALVLARTRGAAQTLTHYFATRVIEKIYWALVSGVPRPLSGAITAPLAKTINEDGLERTQIVAQDAEESHSAHTDYATQDRAAPDFAWVAFRPRTGRTHQIRAHSAAIGHPIIGDGKYRDPANRDDIHNKYGGLIKKKLHLHAYSIMIPPFSSESGKKRRATKCVAPLDGHMAASWDALGFEAGEFENPFEEWEI